MWMLLGVPLATFMQHCHRRHCHHHLHHLRHPTLLASRCLETVSSSLLASLGDSLYSDGQSLAGAGAEEPTSQAQEGSTSGSLTIRRCPQGFPSDPTLACLIRSPFSSDLPWSPGIRATCCWSLTSLHFIKPGTSACPVRRATKVSEPPAPTETLI